MFQRGRISDPRTIRLLASPVRQDIVDTVEALGGSASVRELAERLGRPADGLYYHLEILRKGGLLRAAAGRSRAGRDERRYAVPVRRGESLRLVYHRGNAGAVRAVARSMLAIARRDFEAAQGRPGVALAGARRELWAARATGWFDAAALAELNRLLARVSKLLRRPRKSARDKLVSLVFVTAPLAPRAPRRAPTTGS